MHAVERHANDNAKSLENIKLKSLKQNEVTLFKSANGLA